MILNILKNIYAKTLKSHPYLTATALLFLIIVGYFLFRNSNSAIAGTIIVKRESIAEEVNVTGKTKASRSVDLAFERSGKIRLVNSDVGNRVSAGNILATIDASELYAQLLQAQADMETQKSKLRSLGNGTRPEELNIYETQLENAVISLNDGRRNIIEKIQDAYTKADDAVRNQVDQFFANGRSPSPTLIIVVYEPQTKTDLENERMFIETDLVAWKSKIDGLNENSDLASQMTQTSNILNRIKLFLDKLSGPINQLGIDAYKTDTASARSSISTAITNLSAAKEKLNTAESSYLVAKRNLDLKKAGADTEDISAQKAQVDRAQASVDLIQAQLAKTQLRSPLSGIITKMDAKTGEIASAGSPLISIMSESSLEIEANVPEVDVAKINIENPVKITLDAIPQETFDGKVIYIDPAETVVDGVVNFKIRIVFNTSDPRVKSGLTANLDIQTVIKNNVLVLPQSAIIENDLGTFVKKAARGEYESAVLSMDKSQIKETPIKIGVRSQDGRVEIISGLTEGDEVQNIGLKVQ